MVIDFEGSHLQSQLRGRIRHLERQMEQVFPQCYDAVIAALDLDPVNTAKVEYAIKKVQDRFKDAGFKHVAY